MVRCAQRARWLSVALLALLLTACGGMTGLVNTTPTIFDLTQRPSDFAGKEITAQGYYLWRPGDPATSVLLPGVSTADNALDAQPVYASVACDAAGSCKPSTATPGEASTGSVWLENFPAEVTADLHRPGDAVWGAVEVVGTFDASGGYGPGGGYNYRMQVKSARALEQVERLVSAVENTPLGEGKVSLFDLAANPAQFDGQNVTSQGYYFWTPATQGAFVEKVVREKADDPQNTVGLAPLPEGIVMGMDGFPAEQSGQLNVGPNGSFVWGLVEVTGTFQIGTFGPDGRYQQQIKVESVKVLEQAQQQ